MSANKEGGRFYLYTHMIKTEGEGNTNCVEEIKKAREAPRGNSQQDKLRHTWEETEEKRDNGKI